MSHNAALFEFMQINQLGDNQAPSGVYNGQISVYNHRYNSLIYYGIASSILFTCRSISKGLEHLVMITCLCY